MGRGIALELIGVEKRFGRLSVLRRVDLQVAAGEVVGLLGANGAGKTTLLSIVAGLVPATDGRLRYGGHEGEPGLEQRSRMALVSHTAQVYGRLTARENLLLFAELRRAAGALVGDPERALGRLGLRHAMDRQAGTFSRGMLQRLALARALLGQPDLLLMDEPFTALDRPGRQLLCTVLAEERERGAAVLLSSHDFDAIAVTTDRAVLLEDGTIAGAVSRVAADDLDGTDYAPRLQRLAGHAGRAGTEVEHAHV